MKKYLILLVIWTMTFQILQAQTVFINEMNHGASNVNDRGIGIAGPAATDLSGWKIVLYDDNGNAYHTESIAPGSSIDNEGGIGYGEIWYPMPTLTDNNGKVTAAVIDATPAVVQMLTFSSAPSTVTALDGAASGSTSQAAPLLQTASANALQLIGTGPSYTDFIATTGWTNLVGSSPGDINNTGGQTFSALPVELMNFDGLKINQHIQLNWRTATEENNQKFVIERSEEGKQFEPLGNVIGAGTTTQIQTYNYTDMQPITGWNYYRLKQIDDNGTSSYSEILSIFHEKEKGISIDPNPIRQGQSLQIHSSFDEKIVIKIRSINGQVIKELIINQLTTTISLPNLSNGIYIYQVIKGGKTIATERLIIVQ